MSLWSQRMITMAVVSMTTVGLAVYGIGIDLPTWAISIALALLLFAVRALVSAITNAIAKNSN